MKQQSPNPQMRLLISNMCTTYNFSLQTLHTTISILMNPNLPELSNQDPDICIAALFISQKLHEVQPIGIQELCSRALVDQKVVKDMQLLVLRAVQFKIAERLLIDECTQVATYWDQFLKGITCIKVRFFHPSNQAQQIDQKQNTLHSKTTTSTYPFNNFQYNNKYAYKILTQTCERLVYRKQTSRYSKKKLSLAILALCIKQIEKYQTRHSKKLNENNKSSTLLHKSNRNNTQDKDLSKNKLNPANTNCKTLQKTKQKQRILKQSKPSIPKPINKQNKQPSHPHSLNLNKKLQKMGIKQYKSTDIIIKDFMSQKYNINYTQQLQQQLEYIQNINTGLKDITIAINNINNIGQKYRNNMISWQQQFI